MFFFKWYSAYYWWNNVHYNDVIMDTIASQITSLTIVYSTVYSDADQRKHQSSASLALVRGIHRGPVNFPHRWPVTRKMFPFDDVIMLHTRMSWWTTHSGAWNLSADAALTTKLHLLPGKFLWLPMIWNHLCWQMTSFKMADEIWWHFGVKTCSHYKKYRTTLKQK